MTDEADALTKRIARMEAEIDRLKSQPSMRRGTRKRSSIRILGMPLYDIATGPDPESGEVHGHAKGFFAFGDVATGVVAVGGFARGIIACGGAAIGLLFAMGGAAVGGIALGGAAAGGIAIGGAAAGYAAVGGGAAGYYACGGGAVGEHVIDPTRQDPAAIEFFRQWLPMFDSIMRDMKK
jgi:hypothetical protein